MRRLRLGLGLSDSVKPWHPSQENFGMLFLPGGYSVNGSGNGTWTGVASAGASAGRNLTRATTAPAANAAGYPEFVTGKGSLTNALNFTSVTSAGLGTAICILAANVGGIQNGFGDADGWISSAVSATSNAINVLFYDNPSTPKALGRVLPDGKLFTFYAATWDSSNLRVRYNTDSFLSTACGAMAGTSAIRCGFGTSNQGKVRAYALSPVKLSDAVIDKFYRWALSRGYLS